MLDAFAEVTVGLKINFNRTCHLGSMTASGYVSQPAPVDLAKELQQNLVQEPEEPANRFSTSQISMFDKVWRAWISRSQSLSWQTNVGSRLNSPYTKHAFE